MTGSDTGVGKTVAAAALVRHAAQAGKRVLGVKPFCSGSAEDVDALAVAAGTTADRSAINPWFFDEPLTPLLAARRARHRVSAAEVIQFVEASAAGRDVLVVEGAGGLLSPLGEGYDARDLIRRTKGLWRVVVVVPNRLGAINQALLVLEALGPEARKARVALVSPSSPTLVSRTNLQLLRERLSGAVVIPFPWLRDPFPRTSSVAARRAAEALLR